MLKKIVYALALTGLASGQAFALTDPGFEDGSNWITPIGGLTRVEYGTPQADVEVRDDAYDMQPNGLGGLVGTVTVDAVSLPGTTGVGSYFGLLETCAANITAQNCNPASAAYSFNLGGPVSAYGDYFLVRLMTADYEPQFNDKVTVTYYGTAGVLATDHVSVFSENVADSNWVETGGYWDSNWAAFGVPVGTSAIQVEVLNAAASGQPAGWNLYNRPIVAIDYAPAAPIPEAGTTAMMLAGLGVLGAVSRRRTKRAA